MHQIQSKNDNIRETVTKSLKKPIVRKIQVKHKVKENALHTQQRKIKVKSTVLGSTEGKGKGKMEESSLEEGPRADMLKRILGRKVRDKHGKYGNEGQGTG